jgi:HEAT repeat protein
VFRWNKQKDINEPTQKAIIVHDQGREDLVLQVKYEGPAEDFGWLIPVPGLPEVRKGSMGCFYELSKLTQQHFGENRVMTAGISHGMSAEGAVKVIEIKTVGAYEVAVISARNAASLGEWLDAHHFIFPKENQDVLDSYVKKQWYFVAARIDPNQSGFTLVSGAPKKTPIPTSTRKQLASGELHPLVISFPSDKCVFPLAISAVNGKPSEVSLYVLSAEPVMSRVIFERKVEAYRRERAEWIRQRPERQRKREESMKHLEELRASMAERSSPWDAGAEDPRPDPATMRRLLGADLPQRALTESDEDFYGGRDLVRSLEAAPGDLRATSRQLPRLKGKSWWVTKQVQTFAVEEMRDLEFEPAVPILASELRAAEGSGPAHCLAQFGPRALPIVLAGLQSADRSERRLALSILAEIEEPRRLTPLEAGPQGFGSRPMDSRLATPLLKLLGDDDARIRRKACEAVRANWDPSFVPRLTDLLRDGDEDVRSEAFYCLSRHQLDLEAQQPAYRRMVEEDGPAAPKAMVLLNSRQDFPLTREQLVRLLSSTNLPVVSMAFGRLREDNLDPSELAPLLTSPLPHARLMGLGALVRIGDKAAVERLVAMLRDPNEAIRWMVRSNLRRFTGQKLGADPAAWEKWWAENKETFTPPPPGRAGLRRN